MSFFQNILLLYIVSTLLPPEFFWTFFAIGFGLLWWFTSTGMSLRRKVAISSWSPPDSPAIFAKISIDATKALEYIENLRNKGEKVTITHLVGNLKNKISLIFEGRAAGIAIAKSGMNGRLVFGRFIPNETADISFLVNIEGKNLANTVIREVDKFN